MKDPYAVLGVDRNATDEQIKAAYREMARKYHPDNFGSDPTAAELANEKMQEINEAYDKIISSRRFGKTDNKRYNQSNNWGAGNETAGSDFNDVRSLINAGRFEDAQEILDGVPPENRTAVNRKRRRVVLFKRLRALPPRLVRRCVYEHGKRLPHGSVKCGIPCGVQPDAAQPQWVCVLPWQRRRCRM